MVLPVLTGNCSAFSERLKQVTNVLSIDSVVSTDVDVAVPRIDQSDLEHVATVVDARNGVITSTYVLNTSDPAYPLKVIVRNEKSPTNAKAIRRSSITLTSWARIVDGNGVVVDVQPITAVIAMNTPAMDLETADLSDFWGNLYGLTFDVLNTKVPATTYLNQMLFGLTQYYG